VPTPTVVPSQEVAWQAVERQLDVKWRQQDWAGAITLLGSYLARFPDDATARAKLYAARVNLAGVLLARGDSTDAVVQLELARTLAPSGPADATLTALTPPPTQAPTQTPSPGAPLQPYLVQTGGTPLPTLQVVSQPH
jgi:hypothetical protein